MSWHEFIFSNQPRHRRLRHGIFWLLWWWYFFASTYLLRSPYNPSGLWKTSPWNWSSDGFIISLWMLSLHIAACYTVTGFLLPRWLVKGKYFKFLLGVILLGIVMAPVSHFIYDKIFPSGENDFIPFLETRNNTWWASIAAGPLDAIKIIAAAVTIKLLKRWWIKQKESQQLEREKINAELQLLKAQIHPGFLFNTLNNIYSFIINDSPVATDAIKKLSTMLRYIIYECNQPLVKLEKELKMIKGYIDLEKIRYGENFNMSLQIRGNANNKMICPLLLIPFLENSFKHGASQMLTHPWVNLDIVIEETNMYFNLSNSKPTLAGEKTITKGLGLSNVKKRLAILYPGTHLLNITEDVMSFNVSLKVPLFEPNKNFQDFITERQVYELV